MKKYANFAVYGLFFLLFLFRLFYYREELYDRADEEAHISYLAYVQENPGKWIPEFENMILYEDGQELEDGIWQYTVSDRNGYLRQPPLYYKFMQLVGGVVVQEKADGQYLYVDLNRLKTANLYLTAIVMVLMLYIGYTRLGRRTLSVLWHGVYATAVTSVSAIAQSGTGLCSDNLLCLSAALLVLGLLRYSERKKNYATYGLVAAGFFLAMLSRVSAGVIVLLVIVLAVAVEVIKDREPEFICHKCFLVTVPVYLAAIIYVIMLVMRDRIVVSGVAASEAQGQSILWQAYLPVLILTGMIVLKWLADKYSYRVWHFLGYKAKARRLQKESMKKRAKKVYMPMVLPCILAGLLVIGGFTFEALAAKPENVYDTIQQSSLERQMKKQGYQVLYANSAQKKSSLEEVGYLMEGRSLIQDFTVTEEMLTYQKLAVGIPVGTYGRKNTVNLYVELYQDDGFGKAYKVDCSRVKDKEEVQIVFETTGMMEGICHVKVYSNATNGNDAVTVYTSGDCVLAADMQVAGASRESNLAMSIFTPYDAEKTE